MEIGTDFARELAEALLDAVELAEETYRAVGVVGQGGIVYASRRFEMDDCLVVVCPMQGNLPENVVLMRKTT